MKELNQEEIKRRMLEHLAKPGVIDELIDRLENDPIINDKDESEE